VTPYRHGDRIRVRSIGDDGLPLVRYGFVGGVAGDGVAVMLDGDLGGNMVVDLSQIEAEEAGLQIGSLHNIGTGVRDSSEGYALAELMSGGQSYVLRAVCEPNDGDVVRVRADRPNRWDF
jgi:hypothetical protein